MFKKEKSYLA